MKYLIIALIILTSCSDAKIVQKSLKRAVDHGYVEKIVEKEIQVPVYVKGEDGKDSLIYVPVKIDCPENEYPKSNVEIRQENKTQRKEAKYDYKKDIAYKDFVIDSLTKELKYSTKNNRIETKGNTKVVQATEKSKQKEAKKNNLFWIGFLVGVIVLLLIKLIYKAFKSQFSGYLKFLNFKKNA